MGFLADVEEGSIKRSLRAHLRTSTQSVHQRLDRLVAEADLLQPDGYGRFLASQLYAREMIEDWVDLHCPALLRPPSMTGLLRKDLRDLRLAETPGKPRAARPFALPAAADPVGLAWTIAGSQMGNRAILARLRKQALAFPRRFLSDEAMTAFWRRLVPRLQEKTDAAGAQPAIAAALAVFDRFEEAFAQARMPPAAIT